jgi:hypothetical protein
MELLAASEKGVRLEMLVVQYRPGLRRNREMPDWFSAGDGGMATEVVVKRSAMEADSRTGL